PSGAAAAVAAATTSTPGRWWAGLARRRHASELGGLRLHDGRHLGRVRRRRRLGRDLPGHGLGGLSAVPAASSPSPAAAAAPAFAGLAGRRRCADLPASYQPDNLAERDQLAVLVLDLDLPGHQAP